MSQALVAADLGRGDRGGKNAGDRGNGERDRGRGQPYISGCKKSVFRKSKIKGPSYRVARNLFSENQKSKLGFDWSECQHVKHGDFDISENLFSAKKSRETFYLIFGLCGRHL